MEFERRYKGGKVKMKANTKEINYAKILKHCWKHLGSIAGTLSAEEFNQIVRAYAILLDTNILWKQ